MTIKQFLTKHDPQEMGLKLTYTARDLKEVPIEDAFWIKCEYELEYLSPMYLYCIPEKKLLYKNSDTEMEQDFEALVKTLLYEQEVYPQPKDHRETRTYVDGIKALNGS